MTHAERLLSPDPPTIVEIPNLPVKIDPYPLPGNPYPPEPTWGGPEKPDPEPPDTKTGPEKVDPEP